MKKITLFCLYFFISAISFAQQIVNIVLVGDNGITDDIKKANAFVVVKKYPDCFKRLDYKMHAPLKKLRSYSDSTLTVLNGVYMEYAPTGFPLISGYYNNNLKDGNWYTYNEKGKQILLEKYEDGVLASTLNIDTVRKDSAKNKLKPGEVEAVYKDGNITWIDYLKKNLNADVSLLSVRGGQVIVKFIVNTGGKCVQVNIEKSVEYVLDEEAIRIIEKSPLWQPAEQDGRKVNAYRLQPINFKVEY